jgi:hypothetical protein
MAPKERRLQGTFDHGGEDRMRLDTKRAGHRAACTRSSGAATFLLALCLLGLCLLLSAGFSACASSVTASQGGSEQRPTATTGANSGQSGGNWQTVANLSGESVSSGGGENSSVESTSFDASGPYQVLAACQGSGSLTVGVAAQNSITVHCAASRAAPTRIAGSDVGSDGTIDVSVTPQGQIEWYQVLAQVQA